MERIVRLEARYPYRLFVEFDDGLKAEYDMSWRLTGPVFESLRDSAFFPQVRLDEFGEPAWPNGVDIAPDALYTRLAEAEQGGTRT